MYFFISYVYTGLLAITRTPTSWGEGGGGGYQVYEAENTGLISLHFYGTLLTLGYTEGGWKSVELVVDNCPNLEKPANFIC